MALITCQNLTLSYDRRPVLKALSFSVEKGDYLCIVGENGSGKSTLVKALLGLKAPDNGKITFGDGLTKNGIGYLPQRNDSQKDFPGAVREIVLSGRLGKSRRPFYTKEDKRQADARMEQLKLTALAHRSFSELSGGQQQRVLLARALCATEQLILLDEPTTGLDPHVTTDFYHILDTVHEQGTTVIMVSHDLSVALSHANRVLHLQDQSYTFTDAHDFDPFHLYREGGHCHD